MGNTIEITDADFQQKVIESKTPVLVDFWAEWCGPCKMIAPVLEDISGEMDGRLIIGKVDVDANQSTMMAYGVMGIPALLLFKDGEVKTRITGFRPKAQLLSEIEPHLTETAAVAAD
ncbi:MAG: thioredoxin [Chloroflexota bacterium]